MEGTESESISKVMKILLRNKNFNQALIIFSAFFIFTVLQGWSSIILVMIPCLTFTLFVFVKTIELLQSEDEYRPEFLKYNPLGNLNEMAHRLVFLMSIEWIILFAMGAESLYHPQLIDNYFIFYVIPLVFIYIFQIYYIFYDVGYSARIELILKNETPNHSGHSEEMIPNTIIDTNTNSVVEKNKNTEKLIHSLKIDEYKKIFRIVMIYFLIIGILWVLFSVLDLFTAIPSLSIFLPGSRLLEGTNLKVSFFVIIAIVVVPVSIIHIWYKLYRILNTAEAGSLKNALSDIPIPLKNQITKVLSYYSSN